MGIFFEPKPAVVGAEPEMVETLADAYSGPRVESYESAFGEATDQANYFAMRYPPLGPDFKIQLTNLLAHAHQSDPLPRVQARQRSVRDIKLVSPGDPSQQQFQVWRFLAAILIFASVAGAALGADAAGLGDSSKALYGFAASIFGVVVGLLGGESSAKS